MSRQNYEPKPLFLERMKKLLGKDFDSYMEILKVPVLKSIRCNTLKISPEDLKKRLEKKGWKIKPPFKDYPEIMIVEGKWENSVNNNDELKTNKMSDKVDDKLIKKRGDNKLLSLRGGWGEDNSPNNLIELAPGEIGRALEHLLGYYYMQETASMLPPLVLNPTSKDKVLDLCASPGSKTTQISARMENRGLLVANEVKFGRIKILAANIERCGVMNVIMTRRDGIALCKRFKNENFLFDKILLDAPCSGEGTIRSTPRTLEMWNPKTIENLSKLQKSLIASAIEVLKPNGEIIYSTCTHAPEEDEEVVDFALKNFDVKVEKINLPLKTRPGITNWENKKYSKEVKLTHRIYPQDENTEGFFIAKLKKIK
ncbi:MAG: NOL1/NOP2/sun family putative RNA methylase [Nanoarchaeota archaeon]